jgi:ArsR family transcriptional regulator, lead/cadmium/zinc/bismuth-responsive transcriptional repressor
MNDQVEWSFKSKDVMEKICSLGENQFSKIADLKELEKLSLLFKGLADETRLRIVSILWFEDCCMCEIVSALEGASSTISHHLKIMEKGGVISSRREGKFTIYHLNKEILQPIMPLLNLEGDNHV